MTPEVVLLLVATGFAIGAYAGAIGAGGGFLVAPLLLIRYPDADPAAITAASLCVVLVTSVAQSLLVSRERRVDHPVAGAMAVIAVPAALAGALSTTAIPRDAFALAFAVMLVAIASYILWRPVAGVAAPAMRAAWRRERVDRDGNRFVYRIPLLSSAAPNVGTGFLAAAAGIGGGPVGVPMMTRIMRVPHAIAVPTMHFLILIQTSAVLLLHVSIGNFGEPLRDAPWLGLGVLLSSPAGSMLRRRLGEGILMRALAVGIFFVAARTALEVQPW